MAGSLPSALLGEMVEQRTEKIVLGKDASRPYVGLEHLATDSPDLIATARADDSVSTNTVFERGDVLFGKLRPNLRKCVLAPFPGYCSTDIVVLRARRSVYPRFAAKVLQSETVFAEAVRTAVGTKMPRTSWSALSHLRVFCPHESEQRRIAAILDTLDESIRRTEQVIAKLQQMKQGLLCDFLTRGVDKNGELRSPVDEAPHLFKDSPLGQIPRGWEVKHVEETLALLLDFRGRTPKKLGMEWGGGDIPALSAKNVRVGRIDLEEETYYGSTRLYERWMTQGETAIGDVLLTSEAPLGNVAQIPDGRRYILSQRVVLLRFDRSSALNDFMALQLSHERFQSNLKKWSTGTTATGIQMAKMVLIPVVVPPLTEQAAQAELAKHPLRRIESEESLLRKLWNVKKGLLHDLLTGRVRVPLAPEMPA
jgi:type I restriction enzyme S subunit